MGVNIDKTRGDDRSGSVDLLTPYAGHFADDHNTIPVNRDVGANSGPASSIDYRTVADDQIVHLSTLKIATRVPYARINFGSVTCSVTRSKRTRTGCPTSTSRSAVDTRLLTM